MHPYIKQYATCILLMPPDGDHHLIATAGCVVDHISWCTDHAIVQQRLGKPVDWIAPIILRHGQNASMLLCCGLHQTAGPHRQSHGLFGHHVPSADHRVAGYRVMMPRIGTDIDRLYVPTRRQIIESYLSPEDAVRYGR